MNSRRGSIVGRVWLVGRVRGIDRAVRSGADSVSAWTCGLETGAGVKEVVAAGHGWIARDGSHDLALADPRRGRFPSLHSDARQHGAGVVVGQQWQVTKTVRRGVTLKPTAIATLLKNNPRSRGKAPIAAH